MGQLFYNNARGTLAGPVLAGETTLVLQDYVNLPTSVAAGDWFLITVLKETSRYGSNIEVMKVTAAVVSTGNLELTVVRGQDGTADVAHEMGEKAEARITRESLTTLEGDVQAYADQAVADHKALVSQRKQATLDLDFAAGDYALDGGEKVRTTNAQELLTVERASPKWVEGPNGLLREVPIDTVARQWRQGKPQGVLIEESRTNLLTYSEQFDNAAWAKALSVAVTANTHVAPDGSTTADTVSGPNTLSEVFQAATTFTAGAAYRFSCYLKKGTSTSVWLLYREDGTADGVFDIDWSGVSPVLSTGSGLSPEVDELPGGWYRISIGRVSNGASTFVRLGIQPDRNATGANVILWGAQIEEGSTPSSYIPTAGTSVTRAADNMSRTLGAEFNSGEGTWFIDFINGEGSANRSIIGSDHNEFSPLYILFSGGPRLGVDFRASGGTLESSGITPVVGGRYKIAVSAKSDGTVLLCVDGGLTLSTTMSALDLSVPSEIKVLCRNVISTTFGAAHRSAYYPYAMTTAELEALTTL